MEGRAESLEELAETVSTSVAARPTKEYQYLRNALSKAVIKSLGYARQKDVPVTDKTVLVRLGMVIYHQEAELAFLKRDYKKFEEDIAKRVRDVEYSVKGCEEGWEDLDEGLCQLWQAFLRFASTAISITHGNRTRSRSCPT